MISLHGAARQYMPSITAFTLAVHCGGLCTASVNGRVCADRGIALLQHGGDRPAHELDSGLLSANQQIPARVCQGQLTIEREKKDYEKVG